MIILYLIGLYLLAGLLFSVPFLTRWISELDEVTASTPWSFKLTILPGCIVLWPILLSKYIKVLKGQQHD